MKKYIIPIIISASLLFVYSCGKEQINYEKPGSSQNPDDNQKPGTNPSDGYGYLVMPKLLSVDVSSENLSDENISDDITKSSVSTKTKEEASDDFLITITNKATGATAYNDTYGNLKTLSTGNSNEGLPLTPGKYTIKVRSTDNIPNLGEKAEYSGEDEFTIVKETKTTLDNLTCKLANIKTSVDFSADLADLFKPDNTINPDENLKITLSLDETIATYNRDNKGSLKYFKAIEESNSMTLVLSGMYNLAADDESPNYVKIEGWKQSIKNVKAGQWRKIFIKVAHASSGSVEFEITIETWAYDQEVDVDIMSAQFQTTPQEPELDDPENYITDALSPVLTQGEDNSPISEKFIIDKGSFTVDASLNPICIKPLQVNYTTTEGSEIKNIWVEFNSTNETFNEKLTDKFGDKKRANIYPANSLVDYIKNEEGKLAVNFEGMKKLYNYYRGTHKVIIMAEDSQNRRSFNELLIEVNNDETITPPTLSKPSITWRGGGNFDERHEIVDGMQVVIDIESNPEVTDPSTNTGITGFSVQINSDILTATALGDVGLQQNLDLVNPDPSYEAILTSDLINFPVKDDVRGKTSLVFDISSFMPMIKALNQTGYADFVLTITNDIGTTTKTLQVEVK